MRKIGIGFIGLLAVVALFLALGCSSLPPRVDAPPQQAIAPATGTPLDDVIAPALAEHPGNPASTWCPTACSPSPCAGCRPGRRAAAWTSSTTSGTTT